MIVFKYIIRQWFVSDGTTDNTTYLIALWWNIGFYNIILTNINFILFMLSLTYALSRFQNLNQHEKQIILYKKFSTSFSFYESDPLHFYIFGINLFSTNANLNYQFLN